MLTNEFINKMLSHYFRNEPYESPTTVYVGLFTADGEVDKDSYERQEITFGEPSGGVITNDKEVKFPITAESWGEIVGGGVFDAKTGGTHMDDAPINIKKTVEEREQFTISVGNYTVRIKKGKAESQMAGVVK